MKVLISGAGIAGLTLARELGRLGVEYKIIEKNDGPRTTGAGIALPANAVAALRYLGLGEQLDFAAHQVDRIIYANAHGRPISQASLLKTPLNVDKFVAMKRSALQEILMQDLGQTIQYGSAITGLKNTSEEVIVKINDGAEERFDLVVAADGIHSGVKKLLEPDVDPLVDLGVTNWRFTLDMPNHQLQPTYMFGNQQGKIVMLYPISEDAVYVYAHIVDPMAQYATFNNVEGFKKLFSEFTGPAQTMFEHMDDAVELIVGRLRSVAQLHFYDQRVAYVGDAANACSPMLQQGAAAAFEDVITLSKCLGTFDQNIARVLEGYKALREPRVEAILQASDRPIKLMGKISRILGPRMGSVVRNTMFRLKGPLNVHGWKRLLSTNSLQDVINP